MESIGPYTIEHELGRGAMGIVYRAVDTRNGLPTALKVIRSDYFAQSVEEAPVRQRFMREAMAMGTLSHPGIVALNEYGESGGSAYLAMELVPGISVEQLLKDGALPRQMAVDILRQVAGALDYAHSQHVIHRDIKPSNLLIREDNVVKITDFGIARIPTQTVTAIGIIIGTLAYMAPEQIQASTVDGRADQFSLAVMAHQLLTGKLPFRADSKHALMFQILYDNPPLVHLDNRTLAPNASDVLLRALAKHPDERYPDCTQFVADLARSLECCAEPSDSTVTMPLRPLPGPPLRPVVYASHIDTRPMFQSSVVPSGLMERLWDAARHAPSTFHDWSRNPRRLLQAAGVMAVLFASSFANSWPTAGGSFGSGTRRVDKDWQQAAVLLARKDYPAALPYLQRAAARGQANAMYALGAMYATGAGGKTDQAAAVTWYDKAARLGNAPAMNDLGVMYERGWGVAKDKVVALDWYQRAAAKGEPRAVLSLCAAYSVAGAGGDSGKAASWCRQAADKGSTGGMVNLGVLYHRGAGGLPKNYAEAARWYRKAADKGEPTGMNHLCAALMLGDGVARDPVQAAHWCRQAADKGDQNSAVVLAGMYAAGQGVTKDPAAAARWARKAADQGSAAGMSILGDCYEAGMGVKKDHGQALEWYRKAALGGNSHAQQKLAAFNK